jgi:UPF0716 protein FxsA
LIVRLLFLLMILLAFPVLELVLLIEFAQRCGWWLALYLLVSAILGFMLIQDERIVVFGRMVQSMQEGRHPLLALLTSARKMIAGLLLIIPGVMSDVLALLLLIIPAPSPLRRVPRDEDGVIEGEWQRED